MRDFTVSSFRLLLQELINSGYAFLPVCDFRDDLPGKTIVLRHDVDARKLNSLRFARIEHELGLKTTYYFRIVPQSFDAGVISEIAAMGHEIGYHYEDLGLAKGDPAKAVELFRKHLEEFRKICPITTICMHGSPLSKYDNRDLWETYNYRDYGITCEPYFDIDYSKVFYLTDTGRTWDNSGISVRDKVNSASGPVFRSTSDIIRSINKLPDKVMFTFHPQRWDDALIPWLRELVMQNLKNVVKKRIVGR